MKRHDTITLHEALVAAKRMRPSLTVRQVAAIFGVSKSQAGRVLKEGMSRCGPKCGREYSE
jgi:hypothetical protein